MTVFGQPLLFHICFYSGECRARYINKAAKIQTKESSSTYTIEQESAFVRLLSYINSELLMKKASNKLVDVNKN